MGPRCDRVLAAGMGPEVQTEATRTERAALNEPPQPTDDGPFPMEKILLERLVPPCALVRPGGEVAYLYGRTGRYLEPSPGTQGHDNILAMSRPGLRPELTAALREAERGTAVCRPRVRLHSNGEILTIDLRVAPIAPDLLLVSFHELWPPTSPERAGATHGDAGRSTGDPRTNLLERHIEELTHRLQILEQDYQATEEQLESVNDELRLGNQTLRGITRELDDRAEQLARANDDLSNLLDHDGVATLLLDDELRIRRHSAEVTQILHLIPSDLGRPIGDLAPRLRYDRLTTDARAVLQTLVPCERLVHDVDGARWLMRIRPYRTVDNVIDGLVLTFLDVTRVAKLLAGDRDPSPSADSGAASEAAGGSR